MRFTSKNIMRAVTNMALVSVCILAISGCAAIGEKKIPADANKALVNATDITAYSLNPDPSVKSNTMLHGYAVLGDIQGSGQEAKDVKQEYIDALQEYLDEVKSGHGGSSKCEFQPHHALRIIAEDKHIYDYVVCFTCGLITVYKDDAAYWDGQVRGTAVKLNEILESHHIPLAKK